MVADSAELTIPADLPQGEYSLWMGFYYWATGSRLPVYRDGEARQDYRLPLAQVRVV